MAKGDYEDYGGKTSMMKWALMCVDKIYSIVFSFASVLKDWIVTKWGIGNYGVVLSRLKPVLLEV